MFSPLRLALQLTLLLGQYRKHTRGVSLLEALNSLFLLPESPTLFAASPTPQIDSPNVDSAALAPDQVLVRADNDCSGLDDPYVQP